MSTHPGWIDALALRTAHRIEGVPPAEDLVGGETQRTAKVQIHIRDAILAALDIYTRETQPVVRAEDRR